MKALGIYSALRLAVFAVAFGVLWLVFGRYVSLWGVAMLAVVITAIVSLVAFRRQSRAAGESLQQVRATMRDRFEAVRAAEDIDDDEPMPVADPAARPVADADRRPAH